MFTEEEFNNLVKTYMDTVFRLALNYVQCSHTADDITQNVFIKLLHSNKSFENEDHIIMLVKQGMMILIIRKRNNQIL